MNNLLSGEDQMKLNEVRRKIRYANTLEALNKFKEFLDRTERKDYINEVLSRYNEVESALVKGKITREEENNSISAINKALLEMIRELESRGIPAIVEIPKNHPVKVYFFACDFDTHELKKLLVKQNIHQDIFEFEVINWDLWGEHVTLENEVRSIYTNSRLLFVNSIIERIRQFPDGTDHTNTIDLVITSLHLPKNFYAWNNEDRSGIVISHGKLQEIFGNQSIDQRVLRVTQRMLLYALNIPDLIAHEETRGCVFDLTIDIRDLENSVEMNYLCSHCEKIINSSKKGSILMKQINAWIDSLILNNQN